MSTSVQIIVVVLLSLSFALGFSIGEQTGISRAKRAAIETYRQMHGNTIKTRAVNGPVGYQVHRSMSDVKFTKVHRNIDEYI